MNPSTFLYDGAKDAPLTFLFAHGAGAPMDSPFMESFSRDLAASGVRVVRFEFRYMAQRREGGSKRPPPRGDTLPNEWKEVLQLLKCEGPIVIGGKSMGGRIASLVADECEVDGLVCLGYPFHPIGKPERLRTSHLVELKTPTLIIQGSRDVMGNVTEVSTYELAPQIQIHWLTDGDHSFKPRKSSGATEAGNRQEGVETMLAFFRENGWLEG